MIKDFVCDIKRAMDNKAYLSALALALTLPDICGQNEYFKISNMNNKDKYIKWFDKWIYKYVEIPRSNIEVFNQYDELIKFNGEVCYGLRNALLHHGNVLDNYITDGIRIDRFELCVSDSEFQFGDSLGVQISNDEIVETHIRFNIVNLLNCFIFGIEDYINQKGECLETTGNIRIYKI